MIEPLALLPVQFYVRTTLDRDCTMSGGTMVKRVSLEKAECPVARSLDAIGDWWTLLIVRDALEGVTRFGDFQKGLGVSKGILAARLREMVAGGIFETVPASDGSAYDEYRLTKKGQCLFPVIVSLRQGGEACCFDRGEHHSALIEKATGSQVDRLVVRSISGRALDASDTIVQRGSNRIMKRRARSSPRQ
jgi:DNA-binding HxlR family transcriptional regulator